MNNNASSQRIAIWCGLFFGLLFFIACFPVGGLLPPPKPSWSETELLAHFSGSFNWVKLAMPIGLVAAILSVPWSAVLSLQLYRIEGKMPIWSVSCFGAGCANVFVFMIPFIFWSAAFYRPDRDPALIHLINDMAWLEFVMTFPPICLQLVCTAIVGFSDKSDKPTFPRWVCYLNLWIALLFLPGGMAVFFQHGPFAWNGIMALWVPVVVFSLYFMVMIPVLLAAVSRQTAEENPSTGPQ